jgi:hypothetical protein
MNSTSAPNRHGGRNSAPINISTSSASPSVILSIVRGKTGDV